MFARGPTPGDTPKADALRLLPEGAKCKRVQAAGMTGYSVQLLNGQQVGSGGTAADAWRAAHAWCGRNL